jgi:DNA helicase-2/ATP-dependent DNA helicase PcrA
MIINEDIFKTRYNNLNKNQQAAVDAIYGPVMVIAGPGTGKTEVLSMRIANLLRSEAQVQPHEILCLTYTDEATNAMRRRLIQVIGTAAHRVNICTFHAFCNNVIQNNSEYFSLRSLQPITELERTELLHKMLEELPSGHIMRKLSGNIYYDAGRLNRLFDFMKRENYRPEDIAAAVDSYIESLPGREDYIYKKAGKGYSKGDLKQAQIDEEIRKMNNTKAAAELFDDYTARMKNAGRYDFNDMIIWVLDAFKMNPALLQSYQERHQFILVDEFQDTNGSQNDLLTMLTEFWEDPNIFVVGDDDQSIYEFQGARIRNIIDFYERYKENINIVILPHNYRSSQAILNKAGAAIKNNKLRLIHQLQELNLDKNIISSSGRFTDGANTVAPIIKAYITILHEEADIVMQIEELQQQGVALNDVAILYAQHKQADNIISLFEKKGIPYSVKKPVNILELPLVEQIINILYYLEEERKQPFSAESILFELMHSPFCRIEPTDIALLSLYIQTNKQKEKALGYWRLVLNNILLLESLNLRSVDALRRLGRNIDGWMTQQVDLPLPLLVEKIIYESGIVAHLLQSKDYTWNIQVLNTFFEYVKDSYNRNSKMKVAEFLRMIEKMQAENIAIPVQKVVQNENGVHFYTAHGAKGNEFEYVFLIGCTKNYWEHKKGNNNMFKLPDTVTNTDDDTEANKAEVARRLFYVALTRAKKHLHISYAVADNQNKPLEHSQFIDEISAPEERHDVSVATPGLLSHIEWAMTPVPDVRITLANNQWVERVLQQFTMSYTTLSRYLNCPVTFYYESILKVPFLKNDALVFGSAVHTSLERMFKQMKINSGKFPSLEDVVNTFNAALYSEAEALTPIQLERRLEQGRKILTEYYEYYSSGFHKEVEVEYKITRYILDGVPVTGKIDKMEFDGDNCIIVDYKTGDPDRYASALTKAPNEQEPLGGDYWRQMVFYKLLIENYEEKRWKVTGGMFDYIQKGSKSNEFKRIQVPMFVQDEEIVRKQLKDTYLRIMNHEFDKGCGKEDCTWCNFVKKYELVKQPQKEVVEIDDI